MKELTFQLLVLLKKSEGRLYKPLCDLTGGGAETPLVSLVGGGRWGLSPVSMATISSDPLAMGASAGGHMMGYVDVLFRVDYRVECRVLLGSGMSIYMNLQKTLLTR